jgi:hypothetical protein
VSTLEQASEGVSLDAQRDKIRAYCKFKGIKLISITADEGVSGSTLDRPGLQDALRMLKRGRANTLIVIKLDRLTRSVRDLCALVKEYAPRVPIIRDQAAAAARARALRAEGLSLRAIGVRLRKEGLYPPRARAWHAATVQHLLRYFGEPDLPDAARRAAELRNQGLSLSEVGLRLASEGHVPSRGGFWYPSLVSALLRSNQLVQKRSARSREAASCQR